MSSHALHTNAAVVTRPPRALPPAVIWTPLYSESMVLIVPRRPHFVLPAEPLSALTTAPFIRFDRDTWTGLLVRDVLAAVGVRVREEMELNSVEAIVALVRQGFGVAIVPNCLRSVAFSAARSKAPGAIPSATAAAPMRCRFHFRKVKWL